MTETMEVSSILRVYYSATADEYSQGASWYRNARTFAKTLGRRYGCSMKTAADIIATLSPGRDWDQNKADAEAVCAAFAAGTLTKHKAFPRVGTYGKANRLKCEQIWFDGREATGLKVSAFAKNILNPGCPDTVVIDRHALSIIVGARVEAGLTPKQYELAASHYKAAAKIAGVTPCTMQAVTWVVWRNRMEDFV